MIWIKNLKMLIGITMKALQVWKLMSYELKQYRYTQIFSLARALLSFFITWHLPSVNYLHFDLLLKNLLHVILLGWTSSKIVSSDLAWPRWTLRLLIGWKFKSLKNIFFFKTTGWIEKTLCGFLSKLCPLTWSTFQVRHYIVIPSNKECISISV
jgi:hypothetical protein